MILQQRVASAATVKPRTRAVTSTLTAIGIAALLAACGGAPAEPVAEPEPEIEIVEEQVPEPEPAGAPTGEELCAMLTPDDINAVFTWAGFTVDPAKTMVPDYDHPVCFFEPTEIDFSADVFNLSLEAYPLDYSFSAQPGEDYDRSELPARWAQQEERYFETVINDVPVYKVRSNTYWAFLPDYTLTLNGYGTNEIPEYEAALETLLAQVLEQ